MKGSDRDVSTVVLRVFLFRIFPFINSPAVGETEFKIRPISGVFSASQVGAALMGDTAEHKPREPT